MKREPGNHVESTCRGSENRKMDTRFEHKIDVGPL